MLAISLHAVRDDLNKRARRVMSVLRPLEVVIDNYPDGQVEEMQAVNNPEDLAAGTRPVPFSKVLYIEQDDFREFPPPKYWRLTPGREVRLRYAYFITCREAVKDASGRIVAQFAIRLQVHQDDGAAALGVEQGLREGERAGERHRRRRSWRARPRNAGSASPGRSRR